MSMQALNQLVARSIVDPTIVKAFSAGQVDEVISDLGFTPELRLRIGELEAGSWTEFAMLAYRAVKAAEEPVRRIELPSPAEGLGDDQERTGKEQVA